MLSLKSLEFQALPPPPALPYSVATFPIASNRLFRVWEKSQMSHRLVDLALISDLYSPCLILGLDLFI
jgi:hypothetical protein